MARRDEAVGLRVLGILVAGVVARCIDASLVPCGDGRACPVGYTCPTVCGDFHCDAAFESITTCPGDCS